MTQSTAAAPQAGAAARSGRKPKHWRSPWTPYLLSTPGGVYLAIFFVVPMLVMLSVSLQTGNVTDGFSQTFNVGIYPHAISQYSTQLIRSFLYGGVCTVLSIVLAYPMAYWIAFYGGRRRATYLFLVLLPFLVSFIIRTVSWEFLLADDGVILGNLKDIGLLPDNFRVMATSVAVVGGLTYNSFPFMLLPIYVALERMDPRLLEAAGDLYANKAGVFGRVVLPLSMPGVFAGVLLTFVPATSDYVNASILGGTHNTMIGNIIQTAFLTNADYPLASALSFILMVILLIGILIYARVLGTRDVFEMATR
jgi:spermidine/putrescine transport system permease protein